jgi:hypothetical protein
MLASGDPAIIFEIFPPGVHQRAEFFELLLGPALLAHLACRRLGQQDQCGVYVVETAFKSDLLKSAGILPACHPVILSPHLPQYDAPMGCQALVSRWEAG